MPRNLGTIGSSSGTASPGTGLAHGASLDHTTPSVISADIEATLGPVVSAPPVITSLPVSTTLVEDLTKRQNVPTIPDVGQINRLGRVSETVKDVFVWELRNYFNTSPMTRVDATPAVDKFTAYLGGQSRDQDPYETVVRILRQFPDLTQKMPFIGVATKSVKNNKMALSGKFVDSIRPVPCLVAGNGSFGPPGSITPISGGPVAFWPDTSQPISPASSQYPIGAASYGLVEGDFVEITTIIDGATRVSHLSFTNDMLGLTPQTPRMLADIINLQALYCHASVVFINSVPTLVISAGGPGGSGLNYSIQRTAASANFDAFVNLPSLPALAPSDAFPAMNRYMMSYIIDVTLMIVTEDENTRTELTDLLMDYYCFVMDDRHFTYYGRSFFGPQANEAYQIILKDTDISTSGDQEVPRQDDPTRKYYMNSVSVPVLANQYVDRTVAMGVGVAVDTSLPTPQ